LLFHFQEFYLEIKGKFLFLGNFGHLYFSYDLVLDNQIYEILIIICMIFDMLYNKSKIFIMKNLMSILITFLFLGIFQISQGQKVFSTQYDYQADVKVYVCQYDYQADLKVYKVSSDYQAGKNGKWFFTKYDYQADKKIYFVDYDYQADLKIFFVDYDYQAGWNNSSKQHLMY
jgi:hypothetical protein